MAAPMRYLLGRNVLDFRQMCRVKNVIPVSWSILSRLLHKSEQSSNNLALESNNSDTSLVEQKKKTAGALIEHVNSQVVSRSLGRLFAVVSVAGKQKKITQDDLIIVEDIFTPTVGDRLRLEKVLLVGGKDFTVVGRPILRRDQATVEAVVVEKTLDVPKPVSYYRRRQNFFRFKLAQPLFTILRINKIELHGLKE